MNIKRKILLSYIIIVAVIGSMTAILFFDHSRMQEVESGVERLWQMHDGIHTAHRQITGLALQGEAAAGWDEADRATYHVCRMRTDSLLAVLEVRSNTYVSKGEIDTLRSLLEEKETILTAMMEMRRQREAADRQLARELPDAVKQATRMRQVTVKKTGIAGLLGGKKTVQVAPKADKLRELNRRMTTLYEEQADGIQVRTDSLTGKNEELNLRLVTLINRLDSVAEATFLRHGKELDAIRVESFRTLASVSGVAILLLALSFGVIRRDISRNVRKKREKEALIAHLQATTRKNEELIKARRNIIQTVTHELRTPLTAICGNAELIKNSNGQEDAARRAGIIRQSSGHMAAMLDSLLNYFRIDSGKETVCSKPFPLRNIAETLEAEFTLQTEAKGLRLLVENHADEVVAGDKGLVLRIGANLLSNAVKFTEHGTVRLVTEYRNGVFTIMVEDTGCGMDKEEITRIFTPFERLSNAATKDGFGLGLSIVDTLVKMMDGDISVESGRSKGSRFTVSLPMMPAGLTATDTSDENKRHKHLSGYSVIVIEDNDVLLGTIRDIFTSNGIRCDVCRNAEELTEKMRMRSYDLVITDLKMPDMNGFDILELLRISDIGNSRTVPVAVLTASESVSEKELLETGFTACLFKPYSVEDLLTMSDSVVGKHLQDKVCYIKTPDFSPLLGFGDAESALDRIVSETEADMEKLKAVDNAGDVKAMSALIHKMRSSWMLIGVEGVLRTLYDRLHKEIPVKAEYAEAVERVLEQGNAIISTAKEQKGADA